MLQLVQRGPLTCTTCAVDAAAGTGSTERLESFLDPYSNTNVHYVCRLFVESEPGRPDRLAV